jgi:GTP 3',8-cyclase
LLHLATPTANSVPSHRYSEGQEDAADLRTPLRASEADDLLDAAIEEAIARKPKGHDFIIDRRHQRPALARHMSVTGG